MLNDIVSLKNLLNIYENEVSKSVKNKKSLLKFDMYKVENIMQMKYQLLNHLYVGGNYNIFIIKEPKIRLIMSECVYDKVVNHFVSRYILEPKLSKYLDIRNCATRKGMGQSYAIKLFKKYLEENKKYENIFVLKLDIKKYFYNIDHEVLKKLIIKDLSKEEYDIISLIIDSTDKAYVNEAIDKINKANSINLPYYFTGKGLSIGNQTSQFLAIYYLNQLQHYIIYDLHLKNMVNYMDDYVIIHHNKEYLNKCLIKIEEILKRQYKLEINKNKTYIRNIKYGIVFLGYNFKVINKKTIIKLASYQKRNLRKKFRKLSYIKTNLNEQNFAYYFSSYMTYKNSYTFASKKEINDIYNSVI